MLRCLSSLGKLTVTSLDDCVTALCVEVSEKSPIMGMKAMYRVEVRTHLTPLEKERVSVEIGGQLLQFLEIWIWCNKRVML